MLQAVNGIRQRTFENALREIIETTSSIPPTINAVDEEALESFREDIRFRLGSWYMLRHGADSKGSANEIITLIQVSGR